MSQVPKAWTLALSEWLASEPSVAKAWLFGSRVKGIARPDSDLDIAVLLGGSTVSDPLLEWIEKAETWRGKAQAALRGFPQVDLQMASPEDDDIVWPAVRDHGLLFYTRKNVELFGSDGGVI